MKPTTKRLLLATAAISTAVATLAACTRRVYANTKGSHHYDAGVPLTDAADAPAAIPAPDAGTPEPPK